MSLATLDRQEVERFAGEFVELFDRCDHVAMASFYADDARIVAPDTEVVQGQGAIEEFWRVACESARSLGMRRTLEVEHIETSGGLGYVLSTVTLEIPTAGEGTVTRTFNDVTVWRAAADGRWRVAVDAASPSAPAPPA